MDQVIQSYVANHQFMGSVLVARGDQVIYSKGYGSANLEWDVPNTPATKFRLGSVTKQFTAASILLLEERGKLNVNDPVKKYHAGRSRGMGQDHHLSSADAHVGHSELHRFSGLPEARTVRHHAAKLVARFRDKPLDFEPGEKWSYSNSGYVLLGYLIEKITGRQLREIRSREYLHAAGHEGFRLRFQLRDHSASGLRIRARPERIRERRLHPYDHPARRGRALFHHRGPVEVGAGTVRRQAA